jgi:fucose permease
MEDSSGALLLLVWQLREPRTRGADILSYPGCGLSTLEVAANSYISVLGTPQYAAARLNFSQGFQGVASFAGPLIASRWFLTGANATSLGTVQWFVRQ